MKRAISMPPPWLLVGLSFPMLIGPVAAQDLPALEVTLRIDATSEDLLSAPNPSALVQAGGPVVWVPDMTLSGSILVLNNGPGDYVARGAGGDLLNRVTFAGAMINDQLVPPQALPPVKFSHDPERADIVLAPGGAGVQVHFAFEAAPGFQWPTGRWEPVFSIELFVGEEPVRVSERVRVMTIAKPEDRLNVRWFQYRHAYARGEYQAALDALDELVARLPDEASLREKRATLLASVGEAGRAAADLEKSIDLLRNGRSTSPVTLLRVRDREEVLRELDLRLKVTRQLAGQTAYLDGLAAPSPEALQRLRESLKSPYPIVQVKALRAVARLNPRDPLPELVDLLSAPDEANYYQLDGSPALVRAHAWNTLRKVRPQVEKVPYDPASPEGQRKKAIDALSKILKPE